MPSDCSCTCRCLCSAPTSSSQQFHTHAYPQSITDTNQRLQVKEKKQWISYDEKDTDTEYGFQRKKRFGIKNGSSGVKHCLEWHEESEGEETESHCEGPLRSSIKIQKEPTPKVGHALHTCQCTNAYEMIQLKQALLSQQSALQRNEAMTNKLQAKLSQAVSKASQRHVCGCGCMSSHCVGCGGVEGRPSAPRPAWSTMSLAQALDGETGQRRSSTANETPSPGPNRQNEAVQTTVSGHHQQPQTSMQSQQPQNSARFSPDTLEPSTRPPTGFALPLSQIASKQQQQQFQQGGDGSVSARLSARVSQRKEAAAKAVHDPSRRPYAPHSAVGHAMTESGEGATHPLPNKKGLGNTMLGSPHDPRELHDPESIDPVWRKREEQKERAKRLNALLGMSASDKPIIDEKQYEASIAKQHARRLKIKSFEKRFEEKRLAHPAPGTTTRDFSETWMSVVSGKPPFAAFGNGNTAPATGGLCYGNYMLSHNVSPEKAPNRPNQKQTTNEARRVKEMKRRENAKSLKRLMLTGEVPDGVSVPQPRPSSAAQLRGDYEQHGPTNVPVPAPTTSIASPSPRQGGIAHVPLTQQQQHGNVRNIATGFESSVSPASVGADLRLPIERALAWNMNNSVQEARRSGRKIGYEQEVIGGHNTLAQTSARTMSVPPFQDQYQYQYQQA